MLKTITIKLPRLKFLLLSKFIDAAIDPRQDIIKDPIKKLKSNNVILLYGRLTKILAIGIVMRKGN